VRLSSRFAAALRYVQAKAALASASARVEIEAMAIICD